MSAPDRSSLSSADDLSGLFDGIRLNPAGHASDLSAAAASALRAGSFARAFALSDRRCRIRPPADAHDYLLRAAALRGLGDVAEAEADTRRAAAIEPENRIAARWLLGSPADRARAARVLLRIEREPARIAQAIAAIDGPDLRVVGAFAATPEGVEGWIAWRGAPSVSLLLCIDEASSEVVIEPEPAHALAGVMGSAARCRWPWPPDVETIALRAVGAGALILGTAFSRPLRSRSRSAPPSTTRTAPLTVIVPVYDDLEATRACLDTLLAEARRAGDCNVVAVDDRTPDPRIAALLDAHGAAGRLTVIRNAANLGFARSVNRALARRTGGDVAILNADTLLPPGTLDRLARAAHGAPDIGTVTPFSNNGENTSFPRPFVENDLPSYWEICALDTAARAANAGLVVDMPNGTGFCLYVRGDCLDAIGPLSTAFGRGYLEDSEFCLRASRAGYRSVCAADVYVGHAGGRSFGGDKRALVVRNLQAIEEQFPGYERTCAAFFDADPLASARASMEMRLLAGSAPSRLLVHGAADDPVLVDARIANAVRADPDLLVARVTLRAGRVTLAIRRASGGLPQTIRLRHDREDDASTLATKLGGLPLSSVAVMDPASLPPVLLDALAQLGIWVHDASDVPVLRSSDGVGPRERPSGARGRLAILAPPPGLASFATLRAIVRHWSRCGDLPALTILGESLDDARLIGSGDVWVTGPVAVTGVPALLDRVGATGIVLPAPTPLDHPHRQLARDSGLPTASVADRSRATPHQHGELDPSSSPENLAAALAAWTREWQSMAAAA